MEQAVRVRWKDPAFGRHGVWRDFPISELAGKTVEEALALFDFPKFDVIMEVTTEKGKGYICSNQRLVKQMRGQGRWAATFKEALGMVSQKILDLVIPSAIEKIFPGAQIVSIESLPDEDMTNFKNDREGTQEAGQGVFDF